MSEQLQRTSLIQDIFANLGVVKRLMYTQIQRRVEKTPLTMSQCHVLSLIDHLESTTVKQLADKLCLTQGAVTQLVEPLVLAHYLERQADTRDRRVSHLHMTPDGKAAMAVITQQREKFFSDVLAGLTTAELKTFLKVQQKMIAHLETASATNMQKETA